MIIKKIAILVAIVIASFTTLKADSITISADPWMPFNGNPNTKNEGYLIDIAKTVFEKKGHKIVYIVQPFIRAIGDARSNKINGIVGAYKTDAPDFVFPKNELGVSFTGFYVKKGNSWKYTDINSLAKVKLGVIQGYTYGDEVDPYIKKAKENKSPNIKMAKYGDNEITKGESELEQLINMLNMNEIDTFIDDNSVVNYTLNKLKKQNEFVSAGSLKTRNNVYIAFSPTNPKSKEYANILSNGIDDLKKSGELDKILAKYGLKYWK